jgi:hypothetical protein
MAKEGAGQRNSRHAILPGVVVVGLFFALILIATDSQRGSSLKKLYDEIELGMSRDQATYIIRSQNIYCGFADQQGDSLTVVRFHDLWRSYKVWLDPKTGTVAGKQFSWIMSREPVKNLFRAISSIF